MAADTAAVRVLVLATASPAAIARALARARRCEPGAELTIAVTEVDQGKVKETGLPTWIIGEHRLALERAVVGDQIRDFDRVVIPAGLSHQPPWPLLHLVGRLRGTRFCFALGPLSRLRQWWLVWLLLAAYGLLVWTPLALVLACCRHLDAVCLLVAQVLARCVRRRPAAAGQPVCHVIHTLGTGGAQRQLIEYLRYRHSHPSGSASPYHLLALYSYNDRFLEEAEQLGISAEVVYEACRAHWISHALGRALPMTTVLVLLYRRLRRLQPGWVYSWLFLANLVAAPAARLAGVPGVCSSIRNLSVWKTWPQYRRWWYRLADRWSAPLNDLIVANARAVADDYARWSGTAPARIRVICNGIDVDRLQAVPVRDTDIRQALAIPESLAIVLNIGRLAVEKNQHMLLRCCATLRDRGCQLCLVLVGHGELEHQLREQCRQLGLEQMVHFVGKTTKPESFLRAADLFVLSSRIEGMPNVVMEAQALGLPVVTTDCGGAGEVVADQRTGLVVGIDDEAGMVEAIERLLRTPQLRAEMGRRAVARMRSQLSLTRMVAAIDELTTS